jgi:hypothetical protein
MLTALRSPAIVAYAPAFNLRHGPQRHQQSDRKNDLAQKQGKGVKRNWPRARSEAHTWEVCDGCKKPNDDGEHDGEEDQEAPSASNAIVPDKDRFHGH